MIEKKFASQEVEKKIEGFKKALINSLKVTIGSKIQVDFVPDAGPLYQYFPTRLLAERTRSFSIGLHVPRTDLSHYYVPFLLKKTGNGVRAFLLDELVEAAAWKMQVPDLGKINATIEDINEVMQETGTAYAIKTVGDMVEDSPEVYRKSMFYEYCTLRDHMDAVCKLNFDIGDNWVDMMQEKKQ